ncbi:MAG: YciI family protein [Gemmatimonadetes bacterium]|nr:YciI family protein [Gemmatimonadota bacterium]MYF74372.1 YciI family protein [Gemmatimonadota bacterium]MYK51717.1 YciI family protein [Gemmatimonadota bacterium]
MRRCAGSVRARLRRCVGQGDESRSLRPGVIEGECHMYFVVFATHKEEMGQERLQLQDAFAAYLHDLTQHPDVTVHHGGQTLSEREQIVTGFVLVIEAPSLEVAQAFVAGSPYAQAGTFAESHIRPWNWLTGRPG